MNVKEIVEALKNNHPKAVESVSDAATERLVRAVLVEVAKAVEAQEEGTLLVGGLGRFSVKMVEKKGDAGAETVRKVTFRALPERDEAKLEERRAARKAAA